MTASADAPYPPLALASRVCSLEDWAEPFTAYERLGAEAKAELLAMLPAEWSVEQKRVLDFGCGAGRTLRHFLREADRGTSEVWGTDIDEASISWLEEHLSPPLKVMQNGVNPPLGLEYGTFDLAWALSVFTHLTDNSLPWLAELHKLLRPGGLLVASYMGRLNSEVFTREPWDEDRIGMNVLRRDQEWKRGGPMVFMSDWWIRAHWGRAFEILNEVPVHGQTWLLLRKRDVEITATELGEPADDPREYLAVLHNLRQVERDCEQLLAELRSGYEHSLSWRLTRPIRKAVRHARTLRERSSA
jgi:SAM-dependent methyltransferase